jgi:hypothetical protein
MQSAFAYSATSTLVIAGSIDPPWSMQRRATLVLLHKTTYTELHSAAAAMYIANCVSSLIMIKATILMMLY